MSELWPKNKERQHFFKAAMLFTPPAGWAGQQRAGWLQLTADPLNDLQEALLISVLLFLLPLSVSSVYITASQTASDMCPCSIQHNVVAGSSGTPRRYHPTNKQQR